MEEKEIVLLIREAIEARKQAYCPYSRFSVGAALLDQNKKIWRGCNIESASYSPTNCAERTALFKAVSEGQHTFRAIAIVGGKHRLEDYCYPCGVCRQMLLEFNDGDLIVIAARSETDYQIYLLKELLPHGFAGGSVLRD